MKLRTQLLLGFYVVFAVILLVVGISYQTTRSLLDSTALVEYVHEVMIKAQKVQKLVVDMQARKRGFLITGKEAYLVPYEEAVQSYKEEFAKLRELVADNPRQIERVKEVERLVHRWSQTVALPQIEERRKLTRGEIELPEFIEKVQEEEGGGSQLFENVGTELNAFIGAQRAQLSRQEEEAETAAGRSIFTVILFATVGLILGIGVMLYVVRSTLRRVGGEPSAIAGVTEQIANGNLDIQIEGGTGIHASVARMLDALRANRDNTQRQDWLKTGITRLNEVMSGDPDLSTLASKVISEVTTYLDAQVGALYVINAECGMRNAEESGLDSGPELRAPVSALLRLVGSYAYTKRKNLSNVFKLGEGLVGQAALEKQQILVNNVPEDYIKVTSGLGERTPRFICVTPFLYEGRIKGVIEIGTLNQMTEKQMEYLVKAMPALALIVESAEGRTKLTKALQESRQFSEGLQAQQEELKAANEELEQQTQRLTGSEERLKTQQEELEVTNAELEEKNEMLEQQKREVEQANRVVEEKAAELATASKYKSEFLATMSHELRSPLNSLLLLAQSLAQNKDGNLTDDQVESAEVIYGSGTDLLNLINEILDLSKIEAGRVDLQFGTVRVSDLADSVRVSFGQMAEEKGLKLEVGVSGDAPDEITSDRKRVEQVIRNLVSNALKFTKEGSVTVTFGQLSFVNGHWQDDTGKIADLRLPTDQSPMTNDATKSPMTNDRRLSIAVKDTGIGIAAEKHKIVFEAFQQADGGTARKYGGTGLGLSISRGLANLLGGEIQVQSQEGKGSVFTLYLPVKLEEKRSEEIGDRKRRREDSSAFRARHSAFERSELRTRTSIADDRENLEEGDKLILIIEDDSRFAKVLYDKCHERGFKCLAAPAGEAGLELAGKHLPDGIMLDIRLPGMDGWAVLGTLKDDIRTRHIPVHVVSVEEMRTESLRRGAIGHATKPLNQEELEQAFNKIEATAHEKTKRVLLVEDDDRIRRSVKQLIGDGDVRVDEAATGEKAIKALRATRYGCLILDLGLPDMSGGELLKRVEAEGLKLPPIIIHTARELTEQEEMELREHAESIVIKDVRSQERLLDEVALFLHRVVSQMPEKKKQMIQNLHETDVLLKDKKVLVVDDDMRTTFALSRLLSERGMKALKAGNGEQALQVLDQEPDVDLILMDIMMPVMDGYEAIRRIRNSELATRKVPIIVLTAKAMPEDRQKCIEAGANDYLPKPVDQERLISMMRVWLYR